MIPDKCCHYDYDYYQYIIILVIAVGIVGISPVHQVWPKPSCKTVKGGRRQGRQRKRWEDNIREWTGLEFAKSQKAVENR